MYVAYILRTSFKQPHDRKEFFFLFFSTFHFHSLLVCFCKNSQLTSTPPHLHGTLTIHDTSSLPTLQRVHLTIHIHP